MKRADRYRKWVEWRSRERFWLGPCPGLITGIHGNDRVKLCQEFCEVVEEVIAHFEQTGRRQPKPRVKPMQEIA